MLVASTLAAKEDRLGRIRPGGLARIRLGISHLIRSGSGGADDERNLWPEPRRSVEPT